MSEVKIIFENNMTVTNPFLVLPEDKLRTFIYKIELQKGATLLIFLPVYIEKEVNIRTYSLDKHDELKENNRPIQFVCQTDIPKETLKRLVRLSLEFSFVIFNLELKNLPTNLDQFFTAKSCNFV